MQYAYGDGTGNGAGSGRTASTTPSFWGKSKENKQVNRLGTVKNTSIPDTLLPR